MVTVSQEYSLLRVALGSSGTSQDVILISSGVRTEFAISVTFLERVSGRGESGGPRELRSRGGRELLRLVFLLSLFWRSWGEY
jgi:hypothetical protein